MSLLMRLSFRNLWRNKRRTLLTMSGMAVATALLIWVMGLLAGAYSDGIESVTGLYYGHASITAPHYLDEHDVMLTLDEGSLPESVRHDPRVEGVAGRVRGFMLLSAGEGDQALSQAAEMLGVDPEAEEAVSDLSKRIATGSTLAGSDSDGILLGKTLARRLGAEVGAEVVAMGQAVDGTTAPGIFKVRGLIDTGDGALDGSLALVGRRTLQDMLGLDGRVHEWIVHLESPMMSREWAQAAQAELAGAEVSPWQRMLPLMATMIDKSGVQKGLLATLLYFAVILITVNTMYMAQLERLREFAVMGAIGLRPRRLMGLIVLEGTLMSAIAALAGGVLGTCMSLYTMVHPFSMATKTSSLSMGGASVSTAMRTIPTWDSIVWPVVLMAVLGGLISFFPAWKLGRLRPVDALREV